ncbi:MAG TPA: amidohydrolase, partial [Allosphingosinicella sp.]|nr:amidohydrolase [Allosphingosinicella sp.]
MRPLLALFATFFALLPAGAQPGPAAPAPIRERGPVTAIEHVLVVDGTGAAPRANQTILIDHGRIAAIGPDGSVAISQGASRIDGRGRTAIPGLVGMHEHLFRTASGNGGFSVLQAPNSFPQLYLASGVTTALTAGSVDPHGDLGIRREIEAGRLIGPDLDLTTPYLEGAPPAIAQLYPLRGPAEARAAVRHWASLGFTSVKAYMNISSAELGAAIREAHRLNMRVTGHLCS